MNDQFGRQYPSPNAHERPAPYYTGQGESGSAHRLEPPFSMGAVAQQPHTGVDFMTSSTPSSYENPDGMAANESEFQRYIHGPAPSVQQYGNPAYTTYASTNFCREYTGEGYNSGGASNQIHGDQFYGGQGGFLDDQTDGLNQPFENTDFLPFNSNTSDPPKGMIPYPYQPQEYTPGSEVKGRNPPPALHGQVFNGGALNHGRTLNSPVDLSDYGFGEQNNIFYNLQNNDFNSQPSVDADSKDVVRAQLANQHQSYHHDDLYVAYEDEDENPVGDIDDEDNDVYVEDTSSNEVVTGGAAPEDQLATRHERANYVPKDKTVNEHLATKAIHIQQQRAELQRRGEDDTCPTDPAELLNYVGLLVDAFKMTEGVMDKIGKNGKPAQAVQRLQSGFYSDRSLESAAWDLTIACRDASFGINLVEAHHKGKREGKDVHRTFRDRFFAIYDAVRNSKAVCKQVLDPAYTQRLGDAPLAELKMKGNNKKINAKRDVENAAGRLVNKANLTIEDITSLAKIKKEGESSGLGDSSSLAKIKKESSNRVENNSRLFATPKKRQGSSNSASAAKHRTPASRQTRTPNTSSTTKRKRVNGTFPEHETPAKKPVSRSSMDGSGYQSYAVRQAFAHKEPTSNSSFINSPLEVAHPATSHPIDQDLYDEYCKLLYDFLEVDWREFIGTPLALDLNDLRTFARTYDNDFAAVPWHHPTFGSTYVGYGRYVQFFNQKGAKITVHMSNLPFLQHFNGLSIARNELFSTGIINKDMLNRNCFSGSRIQSKLKKQALGIAENPFGIFDISKPFSTGPGDASQAIS